MRTQTIIVLKWSIGDEFTLSLAKNWHFSFPLPPFVAFYSNGRDCGAEIRNEFTLYVAKKNSDS